MIRKLAKHTINSVDFPCTLKFICGLSTFGKNLVSERKSHQNYEWTKYQLVEMFAPISRKWPEECLTQGLDVCKRALIY
jgi:hypothetical protein